MGWTAPRDWAVGEVVTEDMMDAQVSGNMSYLKGIGQVPTIQSGFIIDNSLGTEYFKLPLLSTAECSTVLNAEGEVAFDEQTHQVKIYNGTAIKAVISEADVDDTPVNGADTVPVSSNWAYDHLGTLTTAGDIGYATGAGNWSRLGIGTANQLLRTNAGATAPEWATYTQPTVVRKTADETVNNSIVQQNDDELLLAIGANEIWEFTFMLRVSQGADGGADIDFAIDVPAEGNTIYYGGYFVSPNAGDAFLIPGASITSGGEVRANTANNDNGMVIIQGMVNNGANAGNIQLTWAQTVAAVQNTKVLANSLLIARKIA